MTAPRYTIEQQAQAAEIAVVNLGGHVRNLRELVAKGKRPQAELDNAANRLAPLQAAAATLRAIVKHEPEVRAIFGGGRQQGKTLASNLMDGLE